MRIKFKGQRKGPIPLETVVTLPLLAAEPKTSSSIGARSTKEVSR